jgi:hypothetical protein
MNTCNHRTWRWCILGVVLAATPLHAEEKPNWLLARAVKLPTEYTNQESGYFSIVAGQNGKIYIGSAKYGVNAYLIEFDPKTEKCTMVVDVMKTINSTATGFAAQAKIHTRNNVGASGKIYFGSKQGYPEKDEKRTDYPGGYAFTYDPKTGKTEEFGIAKKEHGIISVTPDEAHGVAYISTCSDECPIDHTHFMVLDLKKKTYRDLGDMEHSYAFIVVDHKGRALHSKRGGTIARYDPEADKLEILKVTIDKADPPKAFTKDDAILNWEVSPDRKTLFAVEMTTNQLYSFDLAAAGDTIPGQKLGDLLPKAKGTDCRAMSVGPRRPGVGRDHGAGIAGRRPPAPGRLQAGREGAVRLRPRRRRQSGFHDVYRRCRQAQALASHDAQGRRRHAHSLGADGRLRRRGRHGLH